METSLANELWQKIEVFEFDDPHSSFPFSKKLAKENNWSATFTALAIEEYRRFIYLCCTSATGASPSDIVDKVWHLHLTYTQNYWVNFCKETLQKDIHHQPSKGGISENNRHVDWYKNTLRLYREVFGYEAPVSIWPIDNIQAATVEAPLYDKIFFDKTTILFGLGTLLYILATGLFKTKGPDFLLFYALLCAAGLAVAAFLGIHKKQQLEKIVTENYPADGNTFQTVHFIYGRHRSYQTSLVDLLKRGVIDCAGNNFRFNGYQKDETVREINPLVETLAAKVHAGLDFTYLQGLDMLDINLLSQPAFQKLNLIAKRVDYQKFIVPGAVFLIGVARFFQGLANYKPVSFLVLEMGLFSLITLMIAQQYSCNYLVFLVAEKIWKQQNVNGTGNNMLNNFSILGAIAIAGFAEYSTLANLFTHYPPRQQSILANPSGSTGDYFGTSGCSSSTSCSSGSSCGSSCGGGCGGCGGS